MKFSTQKAKLDLARIYRTPAMQVSLTIVLSLFVISFFVIFALRPTIISIVTLKKTIAESQKTLQQLETKSRNLELVATQLEEIKDELPRLTLSVPTKGAEYASLTRDLEILAQQTGSKLDSESLGPTLLFSRILSPFTPSKDQTVVELPFSIRVTGSYASVINFLARVLSMPRIMMVESATITREAGPKNAATSVALNISGSTYYLANEAQLQKALPEKKGGR